MQRLFAPRQGCALRRGLCAGGLPQPGPIFQALPEPLPLPELPQPQRPAEFMTTESPTMAPEAAPGAEAQPGAQFQEHHLRSQFFGITRKLQGLEAPFDGPPGTVPEATQPFAAEAPLTAPGALPSIPPVQTACRGLLRVTCGCLWLC